MESKSRKQKKRLGNKIEAIVSNPGIATTEKLKESLPLWKEKYGIFKERDDELYLGRSLQVLGFY